MINFSKCVATVEYCELQGHQLCWCCQESPTSGQVVYAHSLSETVLMWLFMMTSLNARNFRRYWPLCGEFTGHRYKMETRPVTRSFDVFFDLRLNKLLGKLSWGWWFETLPRPLRRHSNMYMPIAYFPVAQSFTESTAVMQPYSVQDV